MRVGDRQWEWGLVYRTRFQWENRRYRIPETLAMSPAECRVIAIGMESANGRVKGPQSLLRGLIYWFTEGLTTLSMIFKSCLHTATGLGRIGGKDNPG